MTTPSTDPVELLKLMMAETKPMEFGNWNDVLALYATRLSEIAPKLSEDELWRFIALGAVIHQRGYKEFEASVVSAHLLDVVRQAARDKRVDGD